MLVKTAIHQEFIAPVHKRIRCMSKFAAFWWPKPNQNARVGLSWRLACKHRCSMLRLHEPFLLVLARLKRIWISRRVQQSAVCLDWFKHIWLHWRECRASRGIHRQWCRTDIPKHIIQSYWHLAPKPHVNAASKQCCWPDTFCSFSESTHSRL